MKKALADIEDGGHAVRSLDKAVADAAKEPAGAWAMVLRRMKAKGSGDRLQRHGCPGAVDRGDRGRPHARAGPRHQRTVEAWMDHYGAGARRADRPVRGLDASAPPPPARVVLQAGAPGQALALTGNGHAFTPEPTMDALPAVAPAVHVGDRVAHPAAGVHRRSRLLHRHARSTVVVEEGRRVPAAVDLLDQDLRRLVRHGRGRAS